MSDQLRISLKAARVNANMTQHDVCEQMRISNKTLIDWERGAINIPYISLTALANLYGISIDNIFLPNEST